MFPSVMLHCSAPQPPPRVHAPSTQSIIPEYGGLKALSRRSLQRNGWRESKKKKKGVKEGAKQKDSELRVEGDGARGGGDEAGCCQREGVVHGTTAGGHSLCCSVELHFTSCLEMGVEAEVLFFRFLHAFSLPTPLLSPCPGYLLFFPKS